MNMGDTSFLKLQLVKPAGEAYQGTHCKREALGNWLVEVMVTSPMKSIVSWLHETGLICIMNNPNTRPTPPEAPR